jgi:hypothetical protein
MIIENKTTLLQITQAEPVYGGYQIKDCKGNLIFNSQNQIQCERISFYNSNITIQNLNLIGSIFCYNTIVTIINSQITRNEVEKEFVLFADQNSVLVVSNLKIEAKSINAIKIQKNSICTLTKCEISNSIKGITL